MVGVNSPTKRHQGHRVMKTAPHSKCLIGAIPISFRLLLTLLTIFMMQHGYFASKDAETPAVVIFYDSGVSDFSSDTVTGNSSSYVRGGEFVSANISSDSIAEPGASRVVKKTSSDRMRLLFMVGLEGAGHHYLQAVLDDMFAKHDEFTHLERCNITTSYDLREYEMGKSKYVEDVKKARHGMREIAVLEKMLPPEGALVTQQACNGVGMESFPNFGGPDKVLQYPDVRLLAEVAEAEGVDLRVVYLKRSAEGVLGSTTRRGFHRTHGWGPKKKADQYRRYAIILLTDLGAAHSMLSELDPSFITCFDFSLLGDPTQATKLANFTAPTPQMALALADSLVQTGGVSHKSGENGFIDPAAQHAIAARLQRKMDSVEASFCR